MINQNKTAQKPYNFQNQLELGELLLGLGRTSEAELELRKAAQLYEIGADDTPSVAEQGRLTEALAQVDGLSSHQEKQSRQMWMVGTLLLLALLGSVFTLWVFNRSTLVKTVAESTAAAQQIQAQQTEFAQVARLDVMEKTRTVQEIIDQRNDLATAQAVNEQIVEVASARDELAEMEAAAAAIAAQATDSAVSASATVAVLVAAQSETTRPPNPSRTPRFTPTPFTLVWDQLRVTTAGSNLRRGPGMTYRIIGTLLQNDLVELVGKDSTGRWYNVVTEDGAMGWLHQSLTSSLATDTIPVIVDVPPSPVFVPSATLVPPTAEIFPTHTPNADVPPTATTGDVLPTATIIFEPSVTPQVQATPTAEVMVSVPTATPNTGDEITELPGLTPTVIMPASSPTPSE